jgi:serine O-acetyltransferase
VVIQSTPPDVTVVGIPARVVRPEFTHRRTVGRIDLDHHLMPDPVGEALSVMLDRIEFLEAQLAHVKQRMRNGTPTAPTATCAVESVTPEGAKQ